MRPDYQSKTMQNSQSMRRSIPVDQKPYLQVIQSKQAGIKEEKREH